MLEERVKVVITDPQALDNARIDLRGIDENVSYVDDPYEAVADCDAIAIMTEWKSFAKLDYKKIYSSMRKPAFIFDGRNILDHSSMFKIGFNVFPIGKSSLTSFNS